MKKTIVPLIFACLFFFACSKTEVLLPKIESKLCAIQKISPTGRSYSSDMLINYSCLDKHCGILPLSSKNYWVYEDSFFTNGVFTNVQLDTLRFLTTKKSLPDELVWWEGNINIGLPEILYANDSSFFGLSDRLFTPGIIDVKKEFGIFPGDSLRYITSFEDAAAQGRSLKLDAPVMTGSGTFNGCYYFEKNARNYRKDQVYFKPGLGVVKYIFEKAPVGQRVIKLQQVSTLVSFHIE